MFDQLLAAINSSDVAYLRHVAHDQLPRVRNAEWPDLYYLYLVCQQLNDSGGCDLIMNQIPPRGDCGIQMLTLRDAGYMELLRAIQLTTAGDRRQAVDTLKFVQFLGELSGDPELRKLAQSKIVQDSCRTARF